MKVLIGMSIRNGAYCLEAHLKSLLENEKYLKEKNPNIEVDYHFITYNNIDDTEAILVKIMDKKNCVIDVRKVKEEDRPWRHHDDWKYKIKTLVKFRHEIMKKAKDYDYLFMADADVMMAKETLNHLIEVSAGKHIVSTIIMAHWDKMPVTANFSSHLMHDVKKDCKDYLTGMVPSIKLITDNLAVKNIIDCKIVFMVYLMPKSALEKGISFETKDHHFDFKWFSKSCRDKGVQQLMSFKHPAVHMETSGCWLVWKNMLQA